MMAATIEHVSFSDQLEPQTFPEQLEAQLFPVELELEEHQRVSDPQCIPEPLVTQYVPEEVKPPDNQGGPDCTPEQGELRTNQSEPEDNQKQVMHRHEQSEPEYDPEQGELRTNQSEPEDIQKQVMHRHEQYDPEQVEPRYEQSEVEYNPKQVGYDQSEPEYIPDQVGYQSEHKYNPQQAGYDESEPEYNPQQVGYDESEPEYNPQQVGYNLSEPKYNSKQVEPRYSHFEPEYNPEQPEYNESEPQYDPEKVDPQYIQSEREYIPEPVDAQYDRDEPGTDNLDDQYVPKGLEQLKEDNAPTEQSLAEIFNHHGSFTEKANGQCQEAEGEVEQKEPVAQENSGSSSHKRSREDDSGADKKWPGWPGDNVFRLIVPVQKVGAIIGRKGEFVKKMCEDTKARIKILDGVIGTSERIVMVSAKEDPDAALSPAMDALLKVHRRVLEGVEADGDGGDMVVTGSISSRLLVAATQAGSLIGRQGATIKSIQDTSGATVRVLPQEDLPLYALQDDRVVEIHGEPRKVHHAMELVISHLRKFLVDRSVLPLFEYNRSMTSQTQSFTSNGNSGLPMYGLSALQQDSYYPAASDLLDTQHHGVSIYGRESSLPGLTSPIAAAPPPPPPPAPAAVITQVTQHMQIPLSYADAIIGTSGANISYMRRTSGATITVQETPSVPGEMTVEIHGSASQVQAAQQMIEGFVAHYSSYASQPQMYPPVGGNAHSAGAYGSHYSTGFGF